MYLLRPSAGMPKVGALLRCAVPLCGLNLRARTLRGDVLWELTEACRFRFGGARIFWSKLQFGLWLQNPRRRPAGQDSEIGPPLVDQMGIYFRVSKMALPTPLSLVLGPFGRFSAEAVWFRGGPFCVAFLYLAKLDRPPRVSISTPLHRRPAGVICRIVLPYDWLLGLIYTYQLPFSTCLFFCPGPRYSRSQEPVGPAAERALQVGVFLLHGLRLGGLDSMPRSGGAKMSSGAKPRKRQRVTVKTEAPDSSTVVVSSDDGGQPSSSAGPARPARVVRCKVLLDAGTVGITVQRCLSASEFPLQDGVEPYEPIRLASARTSYVELARRLADEFASGTGICYGANDFGTTLWGERVCQALGPVAPASLVGW